MQVVYLTHLLVGRLMQLESVRVCKSRTIGKALFLKLFDYFIFFALE